jgi:hypothetical protein
MRLISWIHPRGSETTSTHQCMPGFNHTVAVGQCIYALVLVDLGVDILGSWLGKSSVGVVCSAQAT